MAAKKTLTLVAKQRSLSARFEGKLYTIRNKQGTRLPLEVAKHFLVAYEGQVSEKE